MPNNAFPADEYITLNIKSDGDFNLGWDFSGTDSGYSPVIANFRNEEIANNSPDRFLKQFVFDGGNDSADNHKPIKIISENATVGGTNQGNSGSMLGLAVSNKRGWMTFNSKTYLISEFKFGESASDGSAVSLDESEVQSEGDSGTQNEYIAAGVYTAFGATRNGGVTVDNNYGHEIQAFSNKCSSPMMKAI